jgi:hypothetical protein
VYNTHRICEDREAEPPLPHVFKPSGLLVRKEDLCRCSSVRGTITLVVVPRKLEVSVHDDPEHIQCS